MKLRNKITGEIRDGMMFDQSIRKFTVYKITMHGNRWEFRYDSLADLCEEWEDYKDDEPWKPKDGEYYWCVTSDAGIDRRKWGSYYGSNAYFKDAYEIGNCVRTREEAERAVEKLKAWKRLKDAGFKFDGLDRDRYDCTVISTNLDDLREEPLLPNEISKDLELLFGGGEDEKN